MSDAPLRIVVLAGGISHERDVSLRSGRRVADALAGHGVEVELRDPDATLLSSLRADRPDVVWPALHGASGEDGALRGLLEFIGIPYVGSRSGAARLAWDKPAAKVIVERAGVPTPRSITLPRDAFRELGADAVFEAIADELPVPLVVKPARGGSAQGVTIVEHEPSDTVSSFLNLRVADIAASYATWQARGAEFLTPPIDRGAEIRCYMRDPDGYLIEVGQSTGLLRRP